MVKKRGEKPCLLIEKSELIPNNGYRKFIPGLEDEFGHVEQIDVTTFFPIRKTIGEYRLPLTRWQARKIAELLPVPRESSEWDYDD